MKLFVDMDGVLTDFDLKASELLDVPRDDVQDYIKEHSKRSWFKIDRAGENFWKNMKWMPDGKELWKNVEIYRPTILTSPSRHPSSFEGKKKWLGNEIGEVPYIIDSDKSKYAENKSFILIDDREKNIDAWEKAGGTGILHKSTRNTIDKLQKILSNIKYAHQMNQVPMNKIVNYLDRIASDLEDKGLLKEAEKIDAISNTLDKIAAEKWIQKADPEEGKFEKWCKDHGFEKGVCQSCINKAAEEGGEAARMANFAVNVSKGKYHYPKKKDASNYSYIKAGEKSKG